MQIDESGTSAGRRRGGVRLPLFVISMVVALLAAGPAVPTVGAQSVDPVVSEAAAAVAAGRAALGQSDLVADPLLGTEAQRRVEALARQGAIGHAAGLAKLLDLGFERVGENVGWSQVSVTSVVSGFEASPQHRANLVDPRWTSIGVGAVRTGDGVYVVVLFGQAPTPSPVGVKRVGKAVRRAVPVTVVAVAAARAA